MERVLLNVAQVMRLRGTCSRLQVGAVIARDGRILSSGYNGSPRGMTHCLHPPDDVSSARSASAPTCALAVHAEANAVAFAARHGVALDGATLYTTHAPCVVCAQLAVNAGLVAVHADAAYRDVTGPRLLVQAGLRVVVAGDEFVG